MARAKTPGFFFEHFCQTIMTIQSTILKIYRELISAFAILDGYFDSDDKFLYDKTANRWNVAQILEHVMLTNQYLLILIEKGAARALTLAQHNQGYTEAGKGYELETPSLLAVGVHKSFEWENPAHMEPTCSRPLNEIRIELRDQLHQCLCLLDSLRNGEGVLYKMTMTVNNLGKLDVYQYIYFLALHVKRHLAQLDQFQFNAQFTSY
jgi:hypothetical protein